MKFEIELYKGQSIEYDDSNDKFVCDIELSNKTKNAKRGSLSDVRKEIDQFIKANLNFKPFKFFKKSTYGSKSFESFECTAIRTDGKFVVNKIESRGSNYKSYLDSKEMESAMIYDAQIEKELDKVESEFDSAAQKRQKIREELFNRLVQMDLSQYSI